MMRKAADLLLFLVILLGVVAVGKSGRERVRLDEDHRRLSRLVGELPIEDGSKIQIRALETGEPGHFAWRIRLPPNYSGSLKQKYRSSSVSSGPSKEFIARVRFREDDKGVLHAYQSFLGSAGAMSLGDPSLAEFLRDRWGKIVVEQAGREDLAVIDPARPVVLLRLTVPDEIKPEARRLLSPGDYEDYIPSVLELTLVPMTNTL